MAEITFGGNFFIGGKSAELNPFSTVSQETCYPSISLSTPFFCQLAQGLAGALPGILGELRSWGLLDHGKPDDWPAPGDGEA